MANAWLFRGTHQIEGRRRIIHQYSTGLEFLRYGRIVLGDKGGSIDVDAQDEEIGFVCLRGNGNIKVEGKTFSLGKYDAHVERRAPCRQLPSGRPALRHKLSSISNRLHPCSIATSGRKTAERLLLEGPVPRAQYLLPFQRVDIALDPFPYPGITTSVENLSMGVPVLTLAGTTFLSRQGVGLLMNAGLPEWIAHDADDYLARAVSHASDLHTLAALRTRLRQQVLASPIFDAPRFARHFSPALPTITWLSPSTSRSSLPRGCRREVRTDACVP